jgi:hypothetical protein
MAEFRDAISRAEKAIVEELDAQTEQQQVERQTAPSVQPQSQPVQRAPAPQAAPQQVDPLARERAAIAQSYQQAQLIQGASEAEQNLAVDIRRHDAWARENFPELNDPTGKALLDLTGSLLRLSERHCLLSLADGRNRRRLRAKKMRNFTHVRADASSA